MNQTYAYMRVSTKKQNEDRRMICMQKLGIPEACGMPVSSFRYCAKKVGKIVYYIALCGKKDHFVPIAQRI